MNTLVKFVLRRGITTAIVAGILLLENKEGLAFWLPVVVVAAVAAFVCDALTIVKFLTEPLSKVLLAFVFMVIGFAGFFYFGGNNPWVMVGVFAFPSVYEIFMAVVRLVDGSPAPAVPAAK